MPKLLFVFLILAISIPYSCKNDNNANRSESAVSSECVDYKLDFTRISKKHFYQKLNSFRRDNKMKLNTNKEYLENLGLTVYTKTMSDSENRKYSVSIWKEFINSDKYYANLYSVVNKELKADNMRYILKTYDNNGKNIAHLDIAGTFGDTTDDFGGTISCDNKILIHNYTFKKIREYAIDNTGNLELLDTRSIYDK